MPTRSLAEQVRSGFPGAVPVEEFIAGWAESCVAEGFARGNSLLVAAVCRDELCLPFVERLEAVWGPAFHAGSLGGLLTLGRTGMAAAWGHAPEEAGSPLRCVAFGAAHIGMGRGGTFGYLRRENQGHDSQACGAVMAFRDELLTGRMRMGFDPDDPEMSLLRQRLFSALDYGDLPDPVGLTRVVADVIDEDLRALLDWLAGTRGAGRPVLTSVRTGVLIHTASGDWFSRRDPAGHAYGAGFPATE